MVKTGQREIRRVRFLPPDASVGDIEVNTLGGIRDRGGPSEFLSAQRMDFDLLMLIESGHTEHTVDFRSHSMHPGDIVWIRAGQVHRWGSIAAIEGPVVMFGPHAVAERTGALIRSDPLRPQNHWPASELAATQASAAFDLLVRIAETGAHGHHEAHRVALAHALGVLLLELHRAQTPHMMATVGSTHEAYAWFRDHIEEHFQRWHQVGEYADRLGYSTRTLNRLARQHTGLSAKQLIDERIVLEAKRLLSHAEASVAEIADQLGFDDASNFSSYFRRHTGTTPGGFRNWSRGAPAETQG
jgi:AraC-like DNA-binding protein